MKRKSLFNRIISLSIVAVLFLTSSASAFADVDEEGAPAVEETVETTEEAAISDVPATEEGETSQEAPSEEKSTVGEIIDEVVEKVTDAIIGDPEAPQAGPDESDKTDETEKADGDEEAKEGETDEENPEENPEEGSEKTDGEEDALEDEEAEEECEHELIYTSNGDGTHTVKCSKCDMEEYTESCEFDEDGKCIHCGYERLPDPVLVYEDDEVIVTVSGAVPENADLKVIPIKKDVEETAEAYEEVDKKLQEEYEDELDYGFVAYDICFIDIESGEEKEPSGDVTVTLDYKQAVLPEDNLETESSNEVAVSVLHFNENSDEIENLTDDNKASLDLDDNKALTKAEFTNDSFSKYVVTWVSSGSTFVKLQFINKDSKTNAELSVGEGTGDVSGFTTTEQSLIIKDLVEKIPNYTYIEAKYGNKVIDEVKIEKYTYRSKTYYYITMYKDGTEVGNRIDSYNTQPRNQLTVDINAFYKENSNLSVTKKATGAAAADKESGYEFTLLDSTNNPVAGEGYVIGKKNHTTSEDGKFVLKTGETAEFDFLEAGSYKIIESGINSTKYTFKDFITKVYLNEETTEKEKYEAEYTGDRLYTVNVSDTVRPKVTFKNFLTATFYEMPTDETVDKFIKYYPNYDDYKLSLKFVGPTDGLDKVVYLGEEETVATNKKVDVILAVDISASMKGSNIAYVKDAVRDMINVFESKDDVDVRWKIIKFGNMAETGGWIQTDQVYPQISQIVIKDSVGTNYDAALMLAKQEFGSARTDAERIVLFLTDGFPTFYVDQYGNRQGTGTVAGITQKLYDETIASAAALANCDRFYAIGMGLGYIANLDMYGEDLLRNLANAVPNANVKQATNLPANQIGALFESLAGTISTIPADDKDEHHPQHDYASDVVITDVLSDYVDIEPDTDIEISIKEGSTELKDAGRGSLSMGKINADGTGSDPATYTIIEGDKTYTATAKYFVETTETGEKLRKVTLSFSEGYVLDKGYSYEVQFKVVPSELAYTTYKTSGYIHTGDKDTDNVTADYPTSSEKPGFYSNAMAEVTYNYKSNLVTSAFKKPVVQVKINNILEIYKTGPDGKEGERLDDAEFTLTEIGATDSIKGTSAIEDSKNGLVEWDKELVAGKTYILKETKAPYGYMASDENWKIVLDADKKPTIYPCDADGNVAEGQNPFTLEVDDTKIGEGIVTYRIYYKNLQVYSLPETGGNGIYRTTLYGIVLMMTSVFLFYRNKKKKAYS